MVAKGSTSFASKAAKDKDGFTTVVRRQWKQKYGEASKSQEVRPSEPEGLSSPEKEGELIKLGGG